MKNKKDKLYLISKFENKEDLKLLDMRFLPPKILKPRDLADFKVLARNTEMVDIASNTVQFLTPSMVALQVNIANEAMLEVKKMRSSIESIYLEQGFENKYMGELVIGHTLEIYNYIEHVQKAIIFSFTALETFINLSIPQDYIWVKNTTKKVESYNKNQIERYVSWKEKINLVVTDIYKVPQIKEEKFWSQLFELLEIRNKLIHIKSVDDTEVLTILLNKDIFKLCYSSQEYIRYISEKAIENEDIENKILEKIPVISSKMKVALLEEEVDEITPSYIPDEYKY